MHCNKFVFLHLLSTTLFELLFVSFPCSLANQCDSKLPTIHVNSFVGCQLSVNFIVCDIYLSVSFPFHLRSLHVFAVCVRAMSFAQFTAGRRCVVSVWAHRWSSPFPVRHQTVLTLCAQYAVSHFCLAMFVIFVMSSIFSTKCVSLSLPSELLYFYVSHFPFFSLSHSFIWNCSSLRL